MPLSYRNGSSGNCGSGNCVSPPLPVATSSTSCYEEYEGTCLTETLTQGETWVRDFYIHDGNPVTISSVQPGAAGAATITLSTAENCLEVGDCIVVYGDCRGQGCDDLNGAYTVTAVAGEIITVAEEIPGTEEITFVARRAAPGCAVETQNPVVVKLLDLTNCVFEGRVVNRAHQQQRALSLRADVAAGSTEVFVCPQGEVSCYDCITIQDAGIVGASVLEVSSDNGFDRLVLSQPSTVTAQCLTATVKEGVVAEMRFAVDAAACGAVKAFINTTTLDNTDGADATLLPIIYRGTEDITICPGAEQMEGDCPTYYLGYYSVRMICTDPATNVETATILGTGPMLIEGTGFAVNC